METYSFLREFADSWVLLAMFGFFIGVAIWAFLPSQRNARTAASLIPLRNDTLLQTCPKDEGATSAPLAKGQANG